MADIDQAVSAIKGSSGPVTQRWKEWITGIYARTQAALVYGMSSAGSSEIAIKASSGGGLYVELQPSTEIIGLLGASTAVAGHVVLDASTARIGSLYPSTEQLGYVKIDQTTPGQSNAVTVASTGGTVLFSTQAPGSIRLSANSTNILGSLYPSTEAIGIVSGHQTYPSIALAVTTSQAYSSGDSVGVEAAFTGAFRSTAAMTGILQALRVTDKGSTGGGSLTFYFLNAASTGTAPVNDAAFDPDDGDLGKFQARVAVSSGDYQTFTDNLVAFKDNLAIPIRATTGTTLYCWTRFLSTGVVYGTTGDVNVYLSILAD